MLPIQVKHLLIYFSYNSDVKPKLIVESFVNTRHVNFPTHFVPDFIPGFDFSCGVPPSRQRRLFAYRTGSDEASPKGAPSPAYKFISHLSRISPCPFDRRPNSPFDCPIKPQRIDRDTKDSHQQSAVFIGLLTFCVHVRKYTRRVYSGI